MHGNVIEWCADWYGDYGTAAQTNPTGPTNGQARVMRGGHWNFKAQDCRSASRSSATPTTSYFGFRVVIPFQ